MIRWIVGSSVRFRLLAVAAAAAAIVVGVAQLREMPVEVLPDFTPATVEIQTEALGLSANEVEQLITVPLEQDLLNGVAFLEDIRSESVAGLSRILLIFEPGTDLYRARQVVAERLTQAHALPQVSKPPQMLQPLASASRLMMVSLSSASVSPLDMSVLAKWTIAPRLLGVQGVSNVAVWGQQERQLQVQVDPARLRAEEVTLLDVIKTAGNALWVSPLSFVEASTPGTGGWIDTPNQRLGIQHLSPVKTADDLAKVRLETESGKKLALGDVATVVEGHQPLIGDAVVNDGGGLLLVVEKFPEANALEVTRAVEDAIDTMRPGMAGIEFDTSVYRPASYIEQSIDNVTIALVVGAVLAVLLLGAFFFRVRTALVSIVAIPVSLVVAVLVLHAFGVTFNAIVLAGLAAALLLVIDDAVVDVEHTARRLREKEGDEARSSTAATVVAATLEMRSTAIYATLVVALAVVPLYFLEGLSGAFFPDIATAFLVAAFSSMLVALTVTPALGVLLFSRWPLHGGEAGPVRWIQGMYGRGLGRIVHTPAVAYGAIGLVAVAGALAVPFLGTSLLPTFKEGELLIRSDAAPGTSLPETSRITALAARELRSIPGVRAADAHVGRAITGDQVVSVNAGELWVSIDPDADYDATVAAVNETIAGYPGLSRNVETYSNERVREVLTGSDDDVVVRLYGEDLGTLHTEAGKVRGAITGVDGVAGTRIALPAEEPTLQIQVDLARAQQHGIKPGDVRRAATTLLSGIHAGSLFEDQKIFEIVVWGVPEIRQSLTGVRNLLLDTPGGDHVRLGEVADVRIAPSPAAIERQAVSRYVDVSATVDGRSRDDVAGDVKRVVEGLSFPLEYHAAVLAVETQPLGRLIGIAAAAVIGMFLLLQAFFGSWRLATLTLVTLPLALAGGLLAALVNGGELSFGSYIALFAVLALAARNSVGLLDRYRQIEQEEGEPFGSGLVLRGTGERVGSILATGMTAALVFVTVLVLGGRAGFELLQPLAAVLLGGLVTSAVLTLVIMPVLYLRFGFSRAAERAEESVFEPAGSPAGPLAAPGGTGAIAVTETRATQEPGHE